MDWDQFEVGLGILVESGRKKRTYWFLISCPRCALPLNPPPGQDYPSFFFKKLKFILTIIFWCFRQFHWMPVSLCSTHSQGGCVRRVGLTLGIWSACGREREGRGGQEENGWQWINPTKELIYQFHQDLTLPRLNSVPSRSCWLLSEGTHVSLLVSNASREMDPPRKCCYVVRCQNS